VPRVALSATVIAAGLACAFGAAPDAHAFCRATTCKDRDDCGGGIDPECKPLAWKKKCIGIAFQKDASVEIPYDQARDIMMGAFAAWQQVGCDGPGPGILVQDLGKVACDKVEFNLTAGNVNVLVFRDGTWPHEDGTHNLALTTVTFDPESGELYNADIEVNTALYDFADGGQYDLLAVLTHEAGHFLGMAHSTDMNATMYFSYQGVDFRSLEEDDVFGICSIYPPRDIDPTECNPIPRHGFSSTCGEDQTTGCEAAPAGAAGTWPALCGGAALLAAACLRRVRRSRGA
jgi:hypothetical protein